MPAALVASGTAYAELPAVRFPLGQTGKTVELTKCDGKVCLRVEKEGEGKKSCSSSDGKSDGKDGLDLASLFGGGKSADNTFDVGMLAKMAEAGSKLFGDQLPLKAAPAKDDQLRSCRRYAGSPGSGECCQGSGFAGAGGRGGAQGTAGRHEACPGQDRQARADDTRGTAFRERRGGRRAEAQGDLQEVHPADRRGSDGAVLTFT